MFYTSPYFDIAYARQAPLTLEVSPPLWLVSHPGQLILTSLWIPHHCHVCIPVVRLCSEVSTAFSLPRQILYIPFCVDHQSASIRYCLLADAVVLISIHVYWRQISLGFSCRKYTLSYSVDEPLLCDAVEIMQIIHFHTAKYINKRIHDHRTTILVNSTFITNRQNSTTDNSRLRGIELAPFRLVEQHLNHCASAVPIPHEAQFGTNFRYNKTVTQQAHLLKFIVYIVHF